jgi:hypothetical protein
MLLAVQAHPFGFGDEFRETKLRMDANVEAGFVFIRVHRRFVFSGDDIKYQPRMDAKIGQEWVRLYSCPLSIFRTEERSA